MKGTLKKDLLSAHYGQGQRCGFILILLVFLFSMPGFLIAENRDIFSLIYEKNLPQVKNLLGDDPRILSSFDREGNSPLHRAVKEGSGEIVEYLLSRRAEVNALNSCNQSPLFTAVIHRRADLCRILLRVGARLDLKDTWGWTALHYAAYLGDTGLIEMLLQAGADPLVRGGDKGWLPIHAAVHQRALPAVRKLSRITESLNVDTRGPGSPLHWAVKMNFLPGARELLQQGADVHQTNAAGNTAFLSAVEQGDLGMAELLIEYQADPAGLNKMNGKTALHVAAIKNFPHLTRYLLSLGVDPGIRDLNGHTAMDWAQKLSHPRIVDILTEAGVKSIPRGPLHLTHVASTGFIMGTSAGRRMMVDCLLNIDSYPDRKLYWGLKRIADGSRFYRDIDLILITSIGSDHFDPRLTGNFLRNNPRAVLVGPPGVLSNLELYHPDIQDMTGRIFTLDPRPGQRVDLNIQGLNIEALGMRPVSGNPASSQSGALGYFFELDGWRVMHLGDSPGYQLQPEDLSGLDQLPETGVDILFVPCSFLENRSTVDLINGSVNPRYVVPTCPEHRQIITQTLQKPTGLKGEELLFEELFSTRSLLPEGWLESEVPSAFDWRAEGVMTPVKDQRNFPACGAFAGCAVLEALVCRETGRKVDLSEQYLINESPDWESCGISSVHALDFLKTTGTVLEKDLSYRGKKTRTPSLKAADYRLADFHYIYTGPLSPEDRIAVLKSAIYRYGPVATNMMGYLDFMEGYRSGIYVHDGKSKNRGSHIITVVGWQDDPAVPNGGYWICKNSWGPEWGEKGYFRIGFGEARLEDFWVVYGIYRS